MPHIDILSETKLEGGEHTPLHRRITSTLARQIEQGALLPGTLLPPEMELARQFGVSRHTMRKGLDALVSAGLVQRRRRKGTVVTRPPVQQSLQRFYSIEQEMRRRGATFRTQVLSRGRLDPHDDVAVRACMGLQIADAQQVGSLLRLRLVDGVPLLLEHVLFPAQLCPQLLDEPTHGVDDPGVRSFYEQLTNATGLRVTHARETFRPIAATGYEARLLRISAGAPVFEVERTSFAGDADHPVEWRLTLARGDHYRFTVDLVNPTDSAGV
jgi:GntR family transcriptional regulator